MGGGTGKWLVGGGCGFGQVPPPLVSERWAPPPGSRSARAWLQSKARWWGSELELETEGVGTGGGIKFGSLGGFGFGFGLVSGWPRISGLRGGLAQAVGFGFVVELRLEG